jgi:signal transduction histidine kinase
LFHQSKNTLWYNFNEQLKAKAIVVAKSVSINPRVVPLPESGENFIIVHIDTYDDIDTLFSPPPLFYEQLMKSRRVEIEEETDEGRITILYAAPSDEVESSITRLIYILIFIFIIEILLTIVLAYWLSGKLIKPIKQLIRLANTVNLHNNTELLKESGYEDELQQLIVSFNRMLSRIKEQSEEQNAFFASASHELRTPLSLMQTRIQVLLQDKAIGEELRKSYLEQLKDVRQMIRMVNDFLLMSELKNGRILIAKTTCCLPEVLDRVLLQYKQPADERELRFKVSFIPYDADFIVRADEDKLQIILGNLINNSLKYSEKGSLIRILFEKKTDDISVMISNSIRKDINPDISLLKKSFYHSHPLHSEGYGLGLWISNRLSEMQGFHLSFILKEHIFEAKLCLYQE